MIRFDGFDEAILGPALIWRDGTRVDVLVYDAEAIRDILQRRDGMPSDAAREYIEFNIEGGYHGPRTPVLVWTQDQFDLDLDCDRAT